MSWRKVAPHVYSAAKATFTGASITLGSTVFSCYLAIQIEKAGHRTLFAFCPHWYANVEYANGIDPELLASARILYGQPKAAPLTHQQQEQEKPLELKSNGELKPKEEDRTRTIFTIEGLVEPAVKRVQDLSTIDLGACAMTA